MWVASRVFNVRQTTTLKCETSNAGSETAVYRPLASFIIISIKKTQETT